MKKSIFSLSFKEGWKVNRKYERTSFANSLLIKWVCLIVAIGALTWYGIDAVEGMENAELYEVIIYSFAASTFTICTVMGGFFNTYMAKKYYDEIEK